MKYLKKFENDAAYQAYIATDYAKPNVSICVQENHVHYNPYVEPPFFCKLTLNDDSVVELEGSGELTSAMTRAYSATCVSAEIGELCTSIGDEVFYYYNEMTSVTIGNSVTSIGQSAFKNCSGLTSIVIPDSVTLISKSVFMDCYSLTSVTISNNATTISDYMFQECSGLTSITIPNSVASIGNSSFRTCINLTSVTIGNSVASISPWAFYGCIKLASITSLAATAPTIQSSTFRDVKTNGTLTVPSGSTGYDTWMDTGNYYLGKYNWTKVEQ